VATMATFGVRSGSVALKWCRGITVAEPLSERARLGANDRRESTSWGSLVRAQYRPFAEALQAQGFLISRCLHRLFQLARVGNDFGNGPSARQRFRLPPSRPRGHSYRVPNDICDGSGKRQPLAVLSHAASSPLQAPVGSALIDVSGTSVPPGASSFQAVPG